MSVAILAEKPSVARDLARVLGAKARGDGYLYNDKVVVTWAIGHLVAVAEPHEIRSEWKAWRPNLLPMLPEKWLLKVLPNTKKQFRVIKSIFEREDVERIICATDAGREGELIFRYIYEAAECHKPIERLWISSLTGEAIREGFKKLKSGQDYEPLAAAAKGRSHADWLVGMNLSRAYSLRHNDVFSVGRVQTPTLAMLVERELEIRAFDPEPYREIVALFDLDGKPGGKPERQYEGRWFDSAKAGVDATQEQMSQAMRLPPEPEAAKAVIARIKGKTGTIVKLSVKPRRQSAPLLYDLTELQRHANRLFGMSAKATLQVAQKLYENHKLISYPRTDSRHLSADMAPKLPAIVQNVVGPYKKHWPIEGDPPTPGSRVIDDSKVSDHHALIPTTVSMSGKRLTEEERRIYGLICRRFLMIWLGDYLTEHTVVITEIESEQDGAKTVDTFHSKGMAVQQEGWKALDPPQPKTKKGNADKDAPDLPSGLAEGLEAALVSAKSEKKQTKPPKRFTDATLLTAMQTAGKTVDDKQLSDAMKDNGLGTPATRAAIIETLLQRKYITRSGKVFEVTDKGLALIERVHPDVKSPEMTGQWEYRLKQIERGKDDYERFMADIAVFVEKVVKGVFNSSITPGPSGKKRSAARVVDPKAMVTPPLKDAPPPMENQPPPPDDDDFMATYSAARPAKRASAAAPKRTQVTRADAMPAKSTKTKAKAPETPLPAAAPVPKGMPLVEILKSRFGLRAFRPFQENVCEVVTRGEDALLVMPTGAGKSLCYQLPGIARGGLTLVVSPLIALMEDQVEKLKVQGFRAERIHSGRSRVDSREVCRHYLRGELDFLFIAPERLAVPGFPEMLAKRKPSLIAIDEAHCISHWGHDFRPEYRLLGERLPILRPAPVIAMTATATPLVQDDIVSQLALGAQKRFIHGFRRTNIAIELVETPPSVRADVVERILQDRARRPAIVYAPTRKKADELGRQLAETIPSASYHAGMSAKQRDRVQSGFLNGSLEVIVATIAFGMGIDKPDVRTVIHTAMPGTLEGYYQEIGRAGRDGEMSRAILLHSYADRRLHEFFMEKGYPEMDVLGQVFSMLKAEPEPRELLCERSDLGDEIFDAALEKLWIHGGAHIDSEDRVTLGKNDWQAPYEVQRQYKVEQLGLISEFAESRDCRMKRLVGHFGDTGDSGETCGICDICAPGQAVAASFRQPDTRERDAMSAVVAELIERERLSTGKLFETAAADLERREFEQVLDAMSRAGLLDLSSESFMKNGRRIHFRMASLTIEGYNADKDVLAGVTVSAEKAVKKTVKRRKKSKTVKRVEIPEGGQGREVFDALREWRLREARKQGKPPFTVFSDRTLRELAAEMPTSEDELYAIHGIGERKAGKYGGEIIELIKGFTG